MIHEQIGQLKGAVPIDEVALALDVGEVRREALDGFEGVLLTDRTRSKGSILVNTSKGPRRERFSIAHELGHFLMEKHVLEVSDGFHCRAPDMRTTADGTRHQRQEWEANRFAIDVLAPTHLVAPFVARDPDIREGRALAALLDISLEASVRCLIDRSAHMLAAVWTEGQKVRYVAYGRAFPKLLRREGNFLDDRTPASKTISLGSQTLTKMSAARSASWIDAEAELMEQTRVGQDGHATTLLWVKQPRGSNAGF